MKTSTNFLLYQPISFNKPIFDHNIFSCSSYLFWTEWGQAPCIGKARLDGSEKTVLVGTGAMWPNGISVDLEVNFPIFSTYNSCYIMLKYEYHNLFYCLN